MADVRGADNEMLANDTSVRRPSETRMNNSEKSLKQHLESRQQAQ